jgi:peptidoglycan/LPS O-acetylase OafA/YrhL
MLSLFLLVSIIIASVMAKRLHRLLCATALIFPVILHEVFLSSMAGEYFTMTQAQIYYIGSMGLSMLSIGLLQLIKPNGKRSELVVHLQIICLLFMLANFAGFWLWYSYLPVGVYNGFCAVLVVVEALRLIVQTGGDKKDGIDGHFYSWLSNDNKRGMGNRG